jgi:excinuclease ABC subunit B
MRAAIDTTEYRRAKQERHNKENNITPRSVKRKLDENLKVEDHSQLAKRKNMEKMPAKERQSMVKELTKKMHEAAKKLDFEEAARYRDEITKIKKL